MSHTLQILLLKFIVTAMNGDRNFKLLKGPGILFIISKNSKSQPECMITSLQLNTSI
jgi:hypothetical protein